MDRVLKLELVERSLGLRHKLKVHESMKAPETHEDLAIMLLAKWELEDELRAIEQLLTESREDNIREKRTHLLKHGVPSKLNRPEKPERDDKKKKSAPSARARANSAISE